MECAMAKMDRAIGVATLAALLGAAALAQDSASVGAQAEVFAAERAFAKSMAERDFAAFGRYVAVDTVFFGGVQVQRGRDAVLAAWKPLFDGATAPFSWEPDQVEVLASGQLALSTGPVRDPQGRIVARFNSIWQRMPDGRWQVIFDKGSPADPPPK
jgi:ketosteroid isomerase-like protein